MGFKFSKSLGNAFEMAQLNQLYGLLHFVTAAVTAIRTFVCLAVRGHGVHMPLYKMLRSTDLLIQHALEIEFYSELAVCLLEAKFECRYSCGPIASEGTALLLSRYVWEVSIANGFSYAACTCVQILLRGDTGEPVQPTWRRERSYSRWLRFSVLHVLYGTLCLWDF